MSGIASLMSSPSACRSGEVFKADGEVVAGGAAPGGQSKQGSYQLTLSIQPLGESHPKPKFTPATAGSKQQEKQQSSLLEAEKKKLEIDLAHSRAALQTAQEHMARARSQLSHLQEKAASSHNHILMLKRQAAKSGDVQQLQEALQKEWACCDAAATEAEQHQAAAAAADSKVQEAQQQLNDALADSVAGNRGECKHLSREASCKSNHVNVVTHSSCKVRLLMFLLSTKQTSLHIHAKLALHNLFGGEMPKSRP
jgi:hypothetical protein